MRADQACRAMQRGIQTVLADAKCILVPMADGGEGTVDALVSALNGRIVSCDVTGSLPEQQLTTYLGLIHDGQTAVIEMAKANGLELLDTEQRNPLKTSSFGTGQLILKALDLGVSKIIIGLGGSATNDAGAGMAQALGVRFLAETGVIHIHGGGDLDQVVGIDLSALDVRLAKVEIVIASDVSNPLCGEQGASAVFGPQKGASLEMVQRLDANLSHFADVVESQLKLHVKHTPGSGAAGGLGFGLMAFTGAKIQSGAALMIAETGLAEHIAEADFVFTGEGSLDFQTQFGKTPWAIAQVAKRFDKPLVAFAGRVGEGIEVLYAQGFTHIHCINPPDCDLETALKNAEKNLMDTVVDVVLSLKK